jgi:hypothetical protein
MPYVSFFFGIVIRMFYREHNPPHFHAEYQGQEASFDFDGNITEGKMKSKTARKLIREWALLHREELVQNWERAAAKEIIQKIDPLE